MTAISDAREAVLRRDEWRCVAWRLDYAAGNCYDAWGRWFTGYDPTGIRLEVDRIQPEPGSREVRHTSTEMVTLCPGHHRGTGPNAGRVWATSHRPLLRAYLAGKSAA